ncbi:MAG: hypothetical protein ACFFBS_09545 [Promethearchaeota archaeon]
MAEDNGNAKDLNGGEDEELLDFDFGEDLFREEEEVKHRESVQEDEIIDLVDVAEEGRAPESVGEDIEGLEELLAAEEEEVPKEAQHPSRADTVPIKKMEESFFAEEPEPSIDSEKEIDLDEGIEEILSEDEKQTAEDVLPDKGEVKEELFQPDQREVVSQYPSGQEEAGKETAPTEEAQETFLAEEPEPSIDLEKEIDVDEALEEIKGLVSEEDIGKLKEPSLEEVIEKDVPDKEEAIKEEAPPISEEEIEALITKVVSEVLEKVARKIIFEVAEKIIREEIDALKKIIMPND